MASLPAGDRGDSSHAVQLSVLLVGERPGELSRRRGLLHYGDVRAPEYHPGKHPQDPQQQPGH